MGMPYGFDPNMMSGFPGYMPMFPTGIEQDSTKNSQIDPKVQQQMNNYMLMMNQMYMQNLMMYKNMMNLQGSHLNTDSEKK
jgi:hypothetical protein